MGRRRGRHTPPASPPLPNPPLAQAPHPRGAQCAPRPAKTNPSAGVPRGTAARCRRPSPPPLPAPPSPPPARPPSPPPPLTAPPSIVAARVRRRLRRRCPPPESGAGSRRSPPRPARRCRGGAGPQCECRCACRCRRGPPPRHSAPAARGSVAEAAQTAPSARRRTRRRRIACTSTPRGATQARGRRRAAACGGGGAAVGEGLYCRSERKVAQRRATRAELRLEARGIAKRLDQLERLGPAREARAQRGGGRWPTRRRRQRRARRRRRPRDVAYVCV
mmetsp:Transcript_11671/g.38404  ORF Transcript_11671/g.38404 Transcript_11671/m.38404 type:complete len:277 (-) Transcript_11671:83-913(-)